MMIRILYPDGRFDIVKTARLDYLIQTNQIEGFRRANGWITLGIDPVRDQGARAFYLGTERRSIVCPHVLTRDEILSANFQTKAASF